MWKHVPHLQSSLDEFIAIKSMHVLEVLDLDFVGMC